jgi:membrane associated rhomboid family serine protease
VLPCAAAVATCYRHPNRETGVSCSNCGNPICPDCMTATPVGMRCPDCSKQKTQVKTLRSTSTDPIVTYVLIAINVLAYFGASSTASSRADFSLFGPLIDQEHEYWRLITSGFMHSGLIHLLFNMYILYWLGNLLEPGLGRARFLGLYFASLLAGAAGAMALSPVDATVGASGAVFGLMAAAFVMQRARGIDPMQSGIGPVIGLNLAITFIIPNISIGGHVGGLIGGAIAAWLIDRADERRRGVGLAIAACVIVGVISAAVAIAASGQTSNPI